MQLKNWGRICLPNFKPMRVEHVTTRKQEKRQMIFISFGGRLPKEKKRKKKKAHLQFLMSEMKTANPRIPSPFDTAGIFAGFHSA